MIEQVFLKAEKKLEYEETRLKLIAEYKEKRERGINDLTIELSWLRGKMEPFGL